MVRKLFFHFLVEREEESTVKNMVWRGDYRKNFARLKIALNTNLFSKEAEVFLLNSICSI